MSVVPLSVALKNVGFFLWPSFLFYQINVNVHLDGRGGFGYAYLTNSFRSLCNIAGAAEAAQEWYSS